MGLVERGKEVDLSAGPSGLREAELVFSCVRAGVAAWGVRGTMSIGCVIGATWPSCPTSFPFARSIRLSLGKSCELTEAIWLVGPSDQTTHRGYREHGRRQLSSVGFCFVGVFLLLIVTQPLSGDMVLGGHRH